MSETVSYAEPSTPPRPLVPLDPDAERSLNAAMLFFLTPLPSALAIVSGRRALRRIRPQGGRGRGHAWVGILLGVAGLCAWAWAANEAVVIHRASQRMTCLSNMRELGLALQTYAATHRGAFPDGWPELAAAAGLVKPQGLLCAADDQTPYIYAGRGLTVRTLPGPASSTVLFYDPPGSHGRHVLFGYADGHVAAVDRPEAIAIIQALHDRAQPAAATVPAMKPAKM
jgi:hypothetical protein